MKIKTAEATGRQLNWGLSKALGHEKTYVSIGGVDINGYDTEKGWSVVDYAKPNVCISLIKILIDKNTNLVLFDLTSVNNNQPKFGSDTSGIDMIGDSFEQAIARCIIAMHLGDEFECPDELEGV